MRVRLLTSVKDERGWHDPGKILDFEDDEARRLILKKAAEPLKEQIVDQDDEEVPEETLEELAEKLSKIDGINEEIAYRLIEAGYPTIQSVAEAVPEDLIKIKGIGKKTVVDIQESAEDLLSED